MKADLLKSGSNHQLELRVGYYETDGQKRVHHANYLTYFERGRVEMLRSAGLSYKQFEDSGRMLVVTEMNIKYFAAAEFDDLLTITTTLIEAKKVRMYHAYRIERDGKLVVEATSTIACVDNQGRPKRLIS
ncbi:Acyl-CoA thioester hydrolase YbgC [Novipirellula galeiformis]|uniref:Acyl-CoA thioester hydrolase YbgC n=1 Tax=Novipirellula galeiformis TaxID=2528004 RepID=A0A5C6CTM2_9BACT|nr:thioesterase family protein [Novipirellula galeiformis]TWU27215.1 Acyl-CoA thioester hydrolase YbgC [Novipirellula galeiformis]